MKKNTTRLVLIAFFSAFFVSLLYSQSSQKSSSDSLLINKRKTSLQKALVESQDFNTTRSNRDKSAISTGQDFNTTRSNKERGQFDVNPGSDTVSTSVQSSAMSTAQDFNATRSNRDKSTISTGQDFNTTRSNKERGQFDANPGTDTGSTSVQSSAMSALQDFNSSRSNRERRLSILGNDPHVDITVSPSMFFPLNKNGRSNAGVYNSNGLGYKMDLQYVWNKFGVGFSTGFISSKVNNEAVSAQIISLGSDLQPSNITSTDGNQTYFTVGPSFQWGDRFQIIASAKGGLFINNPSNITVLGKDGTRALLKVVDDNKKYQGGLVGNLSIRYPLTKIFMLGMGIEYLTTNNSVLYTDLKQQTPTVKKAALQSLGANMSLIMRIPASTRSKEEASYSNKENVPCGPASIKETLPDGSVRDYTFACPDDAATFFNKTTKERPNNSDEKSKALGSFTVRVDKLLQPFTASSQRVEERLKKSGITVTRQTQGSTFGEKVNAGLATASIVIKDKEGKYSFDNGANLKSSNNPLYTGSGNSGENPLYKGDRLIATVTNQQTGVLVCSSEFASDEETVTFHDLLPGDYELNLTGILNFENSYEMNNAVNEIAGIISLSGYANVALAESRSKKHIGNVKYENFGVIDIDNDDVNELGVGEKVRNELGVVNAGSEISGAEITLFEKENNKAIKNITTDKNGVFQLSIPHGRNCILRVNLPIVVADIVRFTVDKTGRVMLNR